MPAFTDLTGLAGVAVAIAASLLRAPGMMRLAPPHRVWMAGAVIVIALIPFNGFPLAAYVRGATGDLSLTTLVLLGCALMRVTSVRATKCASAVDCHRHELLVLVALGAVLLYPMALGYGTFDPYRLGYGNALFVYALSAVALAAWFWKRHLIALCIALALLTWAGGGYESDNLWDYLLDPFVSIYAISALSIQAVKKGFAKAAPPVR